MQSSVETGTMSDADRDMEKALWRDTRHFLFVSPLPTLPRPNDFAINAPARGAENIHSQNKRFIY